MRRFLSNLFKASSTLVLAAGVIGVLLGVERLLSASRRAARKEDFASEPQSLEPTAANPLEEAPPKQVRLPVPVLSAVPAPRARERHFSIKRTKSEVGFVYWILEGYGKHKCFVLCDSWNEAVEQARMRLETANDETLDMAHEPEVALS